MVTKTDNKKIKLKDKKQSYQRWKKTKHFNRKYEVILTRLGIKQTRYTQYNFLLKYIIVETNHQSNTFSSIVDKWKLLESNKLLLLSFSTNT